MADVKVPLLPESISEATVSTWYKKEGDKVSRGDNLVDLETDKVMLEVPAPSDGVLKKIVKQTGSTVQAQETLALVEPAGDRSALEKSAKQQKDMPKEEDQQKTEEKNEVREQASQTSKEKSEVKEQASQTSNQTAPLSLSPSARRRAAEQDIETSQASTKENVLSAVSSQSLGINKESLEGGRPEKRVPMTRIRARIAERLLQVSQNTAMLTTFNEINMAPVMEIRNRYREKFEKKYHIRLGFMSFFIRACVEALKRSPIVNASIDGSDIIYHGYYDIGVAVSTDRGLIVPILRDADQMTMADMEQKLAESAEKARAGKLSLEEIQGGTFTITNGGVFGSLMATPLLNSPQCAILGMHKIEERPVVENGQIVIRPMMYAALSYDHRLIDGKESVTFLVAIKELLEDPTRILLEV